MKARVAWLFAAGVSSFASRASAEPTVDYDLELRVEPSLHQIFGRGRITFSNSSSSAADRLCFHTYLNAFRNEGSSFMRELARDGAPARLAEGEHGFTEVLSLSLAAERTDLLSAARFISPDDGNPRDQTVLEVPLPAPLKAGQVLELEIEFVSQLPRPVARAGAVGDFMMAAQWFPKLGVFEAPPGSSEARWSCHQYHAIGEFYAPFGRYRVGIDVPAGYQVGATGVRTSHSVQGLREHSRFEQDQVHDFAFVVDASLLRIERRYPGDEVVDPRRLAEEAATLGVHPSQIEPTEVTVALLIRPERQFAVERYFQAAFHALTELSLRYGPYPYSVLTVVDPPRGAEETGGMEYPTLVTGGARYGVPLDMPVPESVTMHEIGHQFFYGLLGSNEVEEAWLDEGLTSYATLRNYEAAYGGKLRFAPSFLGVPLHPWFVHHYSFRDVERTRFLLSPDSDPSVLASWMFRDLTSYRVGVYARPVRFFIRLEKWLGVDVLDRALFRYAQRFRYRAPRGRDLLQVIEEEHGAPLPDWVTAPLYRAGGFELRVAALESRPAPEPSGVASVRVEGERVVTTASSRSSSVAFQSSVLVERRGALMRPAQLELTLADGTVVEHRVEGDRRWWRFEHEGQRVEQARLFGDDNDPLNQTEIHRGRRRQAEARPGLVFGAHAAYAYGLLLDLLGALL